MINLGDLVFGNLEEARGERGGGEEEEEEEEENLPRSVYHTDAGNEKET